MRRPTACGGGASVVHASVASVHPACDDIFGRNRSVRRRRRGCLYYISFKGTPAPGGLISAARSVIFPYSTQYTGRDPRRSFLCT